MPCEYPTHVLGQRHALGSTDSLQTKPQLRLDLGGDLTLARGSVNHRVLSQLYGVCGLLVFRLWTGAIFVGSGGEEASPSGSSPATSRSPSRW